MKIFNWVHKRFHHNSLKDGFASNMKKNEPTVSNNGDSTQALLKQVALSDMLGGWKDGILTIGTLGYDPLNNSNINNNHKEYYALEIDHDDGKGEDHDEECYNAENEELNPLMHNTFEHNFKDVTNHDDDDDANYYNATTKEEEVIRVFNEIVVAEQQPLISHEIIMEYSSNDIVVEESDDDQKKKRGERITLADLFLADPDVKFKMNNPSKVLIEYSSDQKPSLKAKHGVSFAKKLIPSAKDKPHPMKDIKKLMKKMLKRKIHPDLDGKNLKHEGQQVVSATGTNVDDDHNKIEGNATIYCLPI